MLTRVVPEGLTFDDVLLVPRKSNILPAEVSTRTRLTQHIQLNVPIVSAAMDTVTEARLAIAMAQQGGIGIIHRNLSVERQASEVDKVKRSESGMIVDPITMSPQNRIDEALEMMKHYKISGVPITEDGKLVGILTNRDLRFEDRLNLPISEVMTKDNLITVPVGTTLAEAEEMLHRHRVEKLLVVDSQYMLKGLITVKDIQKKIQYPFSAKDSQGRLLVGAAVGVTGDYLERAEALVNAQVDVLAVDTAHSHSQRVMEVVKQIKRKFPDTDAIAGNIATAEAAADMIRCGADGIKVGIGPGSICTTRVVSAAGVPQITAVAECAQAAEEAGIPVIADGGIQFSGDITKAIAAGADSVMIGSLFAGTDESPGETVLFQGRSFKAYRGMGSFGAMQTGSRDRYRMGRETSEQKLVPEGIEGRVPYKGSLAGVVAQLVGGLKAGMGYVGCSGVEELQEKARFMKITTAGLKESHVHDVIITREAPNYRLD